MQFASHNEHPRRIAPGGLRRPRNSQILLIGFDDATVRKVTGCLAAMAFEVHAYSEPFDGLAALIDDPGGWMTCIVDGSAMGGGATFQRFVQLFAFEAGSTGMILGNVDSGTDDRERLDAHGAVHAIVRDISDPLQIRAAISDVLAKRGYGVPDIAAPVPPARTGRRYPRIAHGMDILTVQNRLKSAGRTPLPPRGQALPESVATA